jgi:hypothetical protein
MIRGHILSLVAGIGAAAASSPVALAQPPVDDTASLRAVASPVGARVSLAPANPLEGSIVRITFRPALQGTVDSVGKPARDSLAAADSVTRPDSVVRPDSVTRPDSLVRRDSLARPDSLSPVDTIVAIHAALFGEPLHFERDSADVYSAFAGIPVGAADSVTLAIVVARGTGATDTISTTVRIGRGQYRMEKLAVAPAFGVRHENPLAAAIAPENRHAADVYRRSHHTPPRS